ncbi:MarR family winged helix-turn-helix transcriptional regulator [Vibrio sp. WXL103]|uniref:MarR family winged helix-turn-helix transcriptional regulator n=1 Tax=unclassified Vibrio TaxID=2614977 RepID=UPI003EC59F3C
MSQQDNLQTLLSQGLANWPEAFANITPSILCIHRIHDHLESDLEPIIRGYDLQKADFGVLATLRRSGEPFCLSPTNLYRSMLFSSGGLTKVLARLTKAGLITRIENPEDGRSKLVQLTSHGKSTIEVVIEKVHGHENRKLTVLDEQEQRQLEGLLKKLLGQWEPT